MAAETAVTEFASGPTRAETIDDYRLSLHAAGKSKSTLAVYRLGLSYPDAYLAEQEMPRRLTSIRPAHIEAGSVPSAMPGARRPPCRSTSHPCS